MNNPTTETTENVNHNISGRGLKKVNGRGKINTCAKPKSTTRVLQVGNATFVGKNAKLALYLNGAQKHWESRTQRGAPKSSSCGDQKPGSLKCR